MMPRGHRLLLVIGAIAALVAISGWVYFPPYHKTFLLDDFKHFEFVRGLLPDVERWWIVFRPDWIGWHYRPLHHLLALIAMTIFETNPLPYYLSLLALHGLVIGTLVGLALRLHYHRSAALATGLLFAISATHWQVVGWISSFTILTAALFAVLAFTLLIRALEQQVKRQSSWSLVIVLSCFLLALFSREESLLLFPLMVWMVFTYPGHRWRERGFIGFMCTLLVISLSYIYVNVTRSTWVFNAQAKSTTVFTGVFSLDAGVAYLQQLLAGYWAIEAPLAQLAWMEKGLLLMGLLALTIVFYQRSLWGGKLGLLWGGAGLVFIYVLTEGAGIGYFQSMSQKAHMVPSDRYLYLPWIGISLALGASLSQLMSQTKVKLRWVIATIWVVLLLNAGYHAFVVRQRQALWLPEAHVTLSIEQQLKALLPEPPESAHFYAMRATDIPDYFQAMASTWYGHSFAWPGGGVSRLLTKGWASRNDYVFDFEAGVLYDLMPELHTSDKTWLLLQQIPQARLLSDDIATGYGVEEFAWNPSSVVGPAGARRLGIQLDLAPQIQGWHSLCYTVTPPSHAVFQTAVYAAAKDKEPETDALDARVRLVDSDGASTTLWDDRMPISSVGWFPIDVDLAASAGESVELCVEVLHITGRSQVEVAWANPRITITLDNH